MFINDVGQHKWEEIDDGIAGANYGWPICEGQLRAGTTTPCPAPFRTPIYTYPHGPDGAPPCAITGGTFYNPPVAYFPAGYVGDYFFADFCSDWISVYDPVADPADGTAPVFADRNRAPGRPTGRQGREPVLPVARAQERPADQLRGIADRRPASRPRAASRDRPSVKLIGTYLAGTSSVTFNGKPADAFTVVSDTTLLATVPRGATTGPIAVTTGAGTATTGDFTVTLTITGLAPASGPVGTPVVHLRKRASPVRRR